MEGYKIYSDIIITKKNIYDGVVPSYDRKTHKYGKSSVNFDPIPIQI